ncbi:MAG: HAD family hydrolase [Proteobacteria bacterium]|nr:HAD family hydrolase [Pseudomonadota bacterium]MDA1070778.1 HAD family hydrolase [Pseudomonadota bacterium]
MRPAAILLDLDDTILSSLGGQREAWSQVLATFDGRFGDHPHETVHAGILEASRSLWDDADSHRHWRQDIRAARREVVRRAFAALALDDMTLCHELADTFSDHRDEAMCPFPGAIDALEALRARGIPLGLVTNGGAAAQRAKIERFDLARHFDHILVEGEFGRGKPEPEVFHHLMACFGTTPDTTWVVGDNLDWEIVAPQKLGMFAIWCDAHRRGLPEGCGVVPDRIVHELSELLEGMDP